MDTLIAATTAPVPSVTGTATERSPSSSSWSTTAWPARRTAAICARSCVWSVSVSGVRLRGCARSSSSESCSGGSAASRTRPMEVAYAGNLVPSEMLTLMIRWVATRAT